MCQVPDCFERSGKKTVLFRAINVIVVQINIVDQETGAFEIDPLFCVRHELGTDEKSHKLSEMEIACDRLYVLIKSSTFLPDSSSSVVIISQIRTSLHILCPYDKRHIEYEASSAGKCSAKQPSARTVNSTKDPCISFVWNKQ